MIAAREWEPLRAAAAQAAAEAKCREIYLEADVFFRQLPLSPLRGILRVVTSRGRRGPLVTLVPRFAHVEGETSAAPQTT